jgi:5'-nucleotidase (lipoprotein e(P4) family)
MKKISIVVIGLLFIAISCQKKTEEQVQTNPSEHLVMSVLWYQTAGEMRASYYQAYTLAQLQLEKKLNEKSDKPLAVVLDIDETVLDNSPMEGKLIKNQLVYSKTDWYDWTAKAEAQVLPGVKEFLVFADSMHVAVFYISNRDTSELQRTITNLQKFSLPNADTEHVLLKLSTSDKTERRDAVSENYKIALLIGDNLADFSTAFDNRSLNYGFAEVDSLRSKFGTEYIMLPNPMYGNWEKEVYKNNYKQSLEELSNLRYQNIKSY